MKRHLFFFFSIISSLSMLYGMQDQDSSLEPAKNTRQKLNELAERIYLKKKRSTVETVVAQVALGLSNTLYPENNSTGSYLDAMTTKNAEKREKKLKKVMLEQPTDHASSKPWYAAVNLKQEKLKAKSKLKKELKAAQEALEIGA